MRRQRDTIVAERLGNPERRVRIAIALPDGVPAATDEEMFEDSQGRSIVPSSRTRHEGEYRADVITPLSVRPIRNEDDFLAARVMQESAAATGEPAMIFGLADAELQESTTGESHWFSENGIVSPDGLALFNLRSAKIS